VIECTQKDNINDIKDDVQRLFDISLPCWARTMLIAAIASLFVMYGSLWVYAGNTYATKKEISDLKQDMNGTLQEILVEVKKR